LGNSGGGSLLGAYQSIAEKRDRSHPAISEIAKSPDFGLDFLEPGDAFITLNAHPSRARTLTKWMDPSVVDESDFLAADPDLDLWDQREAKVPMTPEFLEHYRSAQVNRNRRITAWAQEQLVQLEAAGASDRVFTVSRVWADPRFVDLSIDASDRSVGCLIGHDVRKCNYGAYGLARICTLRGWREMWALDFDSLDTGTHFPRLSLPTLVIQGTADVAVFPSEAQELFDALQMDDKHLQWVKGADHYFRDRPDLIDDCADRIAAWLHERGF
jgi:pimeloyl-ACP methyl ester carboxylesterase